MAGEYCARTGDRVRQVETGETGTVVGFAEYEYPIVKDDQTGREGAVHPADLARR